MPGDVRFQLRGKDAILHKLVFELRYRHGFTYLDRCGRLLNTIMREQPEWVTRGQDPNPQSAPLFSLSNSCVFTVGTRKYDLALEKPPGENPVADDEVTRFLEQVATISAVVLDTLGLTDFVRIGFRVWYLFGEKTREASEDWLSQLGCFSISDNLIESFKGSRDASSAVAVIRGQDRMFRVAFGGVQQQAQIDVGQQILTVPPHALSKGQREHLMEQQRVKKRLRQNPEFASMIDVDCYVDDPAEVEPGDFAKSSLALVAEALQNAMNGG